MSTSRFVSAVTLACSVVTGTVAIAAEENPTAGQVSAPQQPQVRGRDLMAPAERAEHRKRMRSMKTEEERRAYQQQHHEKMQQRAKEQGLTLPDQPLQSPA